MLYHVIINPDDLSYSITSIEGTPLPDQNTLKKEISASFDDLESAKKWLLNYLRDNLDQDLSTITD